MDFCELLFFHPFHWLSKQSFQVCFGCVLFYENAIVVVWMSGWNEDDKVIDSVVDEDWVE